MMGEYLDRFLKYRCAGDIMNVVGKMSRPEKEITESMGIIRKAKGLFLESPMKYHVIDMCAGNALTGILSVFTLPVSHATAIDLQKRNGRYDLVNRFNYIEGDIMNIRSFIKDTTVIFGVHPCQSARLIIDIFNNSDAKALYLLPCCEGSYSLRGLSFLHEKLDSYDLWTYWLAQRIDAKAEVSITRDEKILSPKNNVISAIRKGIK